MKRILITGCAGFLGHHAVDHFLHNTDWQIHGIASFRHRGDSLRLGSDHIQSDFWDRLKIHYHDLCGPISPRLAEEIGPVDYILNIASESHVDRSISDPVPFVRNNVDLILNMLEYARLVKPKVFVQVSTDEVYGPAPADVDFKEWDRLVPSNPYSASKAAQEMIAISYWRTYGVPVVLMNAMNLIGERQDPEKFVPLAIRCVVEGRRLLIHSDENGIPGSRFYLHARNYADACLYVMNRINPAMYPNHDRPDRWHVVGDREIDNLTLARMIAGWIGKPLDYGLVNYHASRPGHDLRYALDGWKLRNAGWKPPVPLDESLKRTVEWTLANRKWLVAA